MLILSNEEISRLLTMQDVMAALEPMYRDYLESRALLSPRVDNITPTALEGGYYAFKHMGGAWPAQGIQALRINSDICTHPVIAGNPRRVKQPLADGRWVGLVLLFSTETGKLLAMFPDGVMQRMRVGAASGLALKHLARTDASTLALIGTGWQAGAQLMAARAARNFREVRVYSPRRESRADFVAQHADVRAVDTLEACVTGADVILAATSSMVRVIDPKWLKPGMHVGCIKTQEIDGEVLDR
jgi:ornithine cyclodeaminase/alanine dehydrogenase-like protein (mu-crystallin family)